jgi:hypothetical protein
MTPDRLEKMLRELPAPPSTEARERAVADARAEVAGREAPSGRARRAGRRGLVAALAAAVLAAALLTPPGRDASAWVGELVGIGEVGGSPTLTERPGPTETSREVVIENGRAPDGTRYEWVVYDCEFDMSKEGFGGESFRGAGISLDWPDAKGHEGGGSCAEDHETPTPPPAGTFNSIGLHVVPSQFQGVDEPDLYMAGSTSSRVHSVRVIYRDTQGETRDLPVDFARVDGSLRGRVGDSAPGGTFMAFVPGAWAARDDVVARLDLRARAGTGKLELGPYAREERRLMREAQHDCLARHEDPSLMYQLDADPSALKRAERPWVECLEERMPAPPVEVIAYDAEGRELERWHEPVPLPPVVPEEPIPWDKRPARGGDKGEPVVLAAGRAPEGARYEWYVERLGEGEGDFTGVCNTLWWPNFAQVGAHGSCGGDGLPPETAFRQRKNASGPVMARQYGFLDGAEPATRHYMLSGYARPQVDRVRVLWDGGEAPVELTRVSGELLDRIGSEEPFGFWVTFVPPSARHAEFEIVSYDEGGAEIGRYRYRSDVTN